MYNMFEVQHSNSDYLNIFPKCYNFFNNSKKHVNYLHLYLHIFSNMAVEYLADEYLLLILSVLKNVIGFFQQYNLQVLDNEVINKFVVMYCVIRT